MYMYVWAGEGGGSSGHVTTKNGGTLKQNIDFADYTLVHLTLYHHTSSVNLKTILIFPHDGRTSTSPLESGKS